MKARLEAAVADAAAFVQRRPADSIETIDAAGLAVLLGELRSCGRLARRASSGR